MSKMYDVPPEQLVRNPAFGQVQFTESEYKETSAKLSMQLGPEFVSSRPGGGSKITYLEGWKAVHIANEIFGFNGWSSSIQSQTIDYTECVDGRFNVGISVVVRITLKDGSYKEDIGYGHIDNAKTKAMAFEKVKKEAVTDGMKRALTRFGFALGGCMSDKNYLKNIKGVSVPPPKPLCSDDLYRAKEFRSSPIIPNTSNVHDIEKIIGGDIENMDMHMMCDDFLDEEGPKVAPLPNATSPPMSMGPTTANLPQNNTSKNNNNMNSKVSPPNSINSNKLNSGLGSASNNANPNCNKSTSIGGAGASSAHLNNNNSNNNNNNQKNFNQQNIRPPPQLHQQNVRPQQPQQIAVPQQQQQPNTNTQGRAIPTPNKTTPNTNTANNNFQHPIEQPMNVRPVLAPRSNAAPMYRPQSTTMGKPSMGTHSLQRSSSLNNIHRQQQEPKQFVAPQILNGNNKRSMSSDNVSMAKKR